MQIIQRSLIGIQICKQVLVYKIQFWKTGATSKGAIQGIRSKPSKTGIQNGTLLKASLQ
jgi:hypothetical protein